MKLVNPRFTAGKSYAIAAPEPHNPTNKLQTNTATLNRFIVNPPWRIILADRPGKRK
jgi:hypothetical protein